MAWRASIGQEYAGHDLECRKVKAVGEPYEGKPHVRVDVAGGGNQDLGPRRHSLTLRADAQQAARGSCPAVLPSLRSRIRLTQTWPREIHRNQ